MNNGKDQLPSSPNTNITYNLIGRANKANANPIVSEIKVCEWPMGVNRRTANKANTEMITVAETDRIIFLFIFWMGQKFCLTLYSRKIFRSGRVKGSKAGRKGNYYGETSFEGTN